MQQASWHEPPCRGIWNRHLDGEGCSVSGDWPALEGPDTAAAGTKGLIPCSAPAPRSHAIGKGFERITQDAIVNCFSCVLSGGLDAEAVRSSVPLVLPHSPCRWEDSGSPCSPSPSSPSLSTSLCPEDRVALQEASPRYPNWKSLLCSLNFRSLWLPCHFLFPELSVGYLSVHLIYKAISREAVKTFQTQGSLSYTHTSHARTTDHTHTPYMHIPHTPKDTHTHATHTHTS